MTHSNGSHSKNSDRPVNTGRAVNVHDVIGRGNDHEPAKRSSSTSNRDSDQKSGELNDHQRDFAGEPGVILDGPNVSTLKVLLVGNDAFVSRVTQRFAEARLVVKTSAASDYLMALGQAAHVAPDVVIGQIDGLDWQRQSVIAGFRRLSPGVRLIVIAEPEKEAFGVKAVEAGFDEYMLEPVASEALAELLLQEMPANKSTGLPAGAGADHAPGSRHKPEASTEAMMAVAATDGANEWDTSWQAEAVPMAQAPGTRRPGNKQNQETASSSSASGSPSSSRPASANPSSANSSSSSAAEGAIGSVPAASSSGRRTVGPSAERAVEPKTKDVFSATSDGYGDDPYDTSDAELGDIDLVDCLLTSPGQFKQMVLKLVAGRSGVSHLDFTANASDVPGDHAGAWVTFRGRRLGVLHAPPPAVKTQLAPWASWLAHWMAMQQQMTTLWNMANKDELTGAWNRRFFDRHLARVISQAAQKRLPVTVLMFDIDNFKTYNDRYGHPAGDEILRETVRLMGSVIREHDVVARIGGDEFAVVFWDPHGPRKPDSTHPDDVRDAARRFQQAICSHHFPKLLEEAPGTLTISGGLASYPWDGVTAQALVERADTMLLHSKTQGKNAITFGAGAARRGDPFEHEA